MRIIYAAVSLRSNSSKFEASMRLFPARHLKPSISLLSTVAKLGVVNINWAATASQGIKDIRQIAIVSGRWQRAEPYENKDTKR
jgi:hypothetical protein